MTASKLYSLLIGGLGISYSVAFSVRPCRFYSSRSCRLATTTINNAEVSVESKRPPRLLHPRNSFRGTYDMDALSISYPPLTRHICECTKTNRPTITFSDPAAVLALNTALLVADYGISPEWATLLPKDSLVPPIPGRADYIHHIADLLAEQNGPPPEGHVIKGLDVGVGASCVYPLIGHASYGWSFIASDVVTQSVQIAQSMVESNKVADFIEIIQQPDSSKILDGVMKKSCPLDFVMCNPPFYGSVAEFYKESRRKVTDVDTRQGSTIPAAQPDECSTTSESKHLGGSDDELWYEGGEVAFVLKMVDESKEFRRSCLWFTSLVSRRYNVPEIEKELLRGKKLRNGIRKIKLIPMGPGLKSSTIVCWSFLNDDERNEWAMRR